MIIADTGLWVALVDRGDRYHVACCEFIRHNRETLITTYPVLVEVTHLLISRVGSRLTVAWLQTLHDQGVQVFQLEQTHLPRLIELMRQYIDLPMDLADASLILLAEHLGQGRIVSTDQRDFHTYRWKNRHPFQNLLPAV